MHEYWLTLDITACSTSLRPAPYTAGEAQPSRQAAEQSPKERASLTRGRQESCGAGWQQPAKHPPKFSTVLWATGAATCIIFQCKAARCILQLRRVVNAYHACDPHCILNGCKNADQYTSTGWTCWQTQHAALVQSIASCASELNVCKGLHLSTVSGQAESLLHAGITGALWVQQHITGFNMLAFVSDLSCRILLVAQLICNSAGALI